MKLFKKLFKKKEKVEEVKEEFSHLPQCQYCKRPIFEHEQSKTFDKKKYHIKPCWRIVKKEVKKMVQNGEFGALRYQ